MASGLIRQPPPLYSLQEAVDMSTTLAIHHTLPCDLVDAVVPFMGESINDGTSATFLKKPSDRVEVDEPIVQIET
ncbi:hypothetical protein OPV22_022399 [Ensete ventricosum]|uniref:Lipoyl-binding domain-containing protein n=1 Tax=Ensete ventricosum TaxID=4639 RepID=A0AAV8QST3_ENSVE|nr:hypothetical protein OPV22_022399 [Ensete ventricosum]